MPEPVRGGSVAARRGSIHHSGSTRASTSPTPAVQECHRQVGVMTEYLSETEESDMADGAGRQAAESAPRAGRTTRKTVRPGLDWTSTSP